MLAQLTQLVNDVDGAWAAAIGGLDGLLIEGHSTTTTDLSLLVAEHAGLLKAANSSYTSTIQAGHTKEMYLRAERLSVYLHPIKQDYFLLLAVDARSNLGQARLYGRDTARKLEALL